MNTDHNHRCDWCGERWAGDHHCRGGNRVCGSTPACEYLSPRRFIEEEAITTAIASGRLLDLQSEDAVERLARVLHNWGCDDPALRGAIQSLDELEMAERDLGRVATVGMDRSIHRSQAQHLLAALRIPLYDEDAGK